MIILENSPECRVNTAELEGASENSLPINDASKSPVFREVIHRELEIGHQRITNSKSEKGNKKWDKIESNEGKLSQNFKIADNNSDKFYNLTKLAEVSLAAAAGQLFWENRRNEFDLEVIE